MAHTINNAIGKPAYKALSIHERINFKSHWLSPAYPVVTAWRYVMNEVYYGPPRYGKSPFITGCEFGEDICRNPITFESLLR